MFRVKVELALIALATSFICSAAVGQTTCNTISDNESWCYNPTTWEYFPLIGRAPPKTAFEAAVDVCQRHADVYNPHDFVFTYKRNPQFAEGCKSIIETWKKHLAERSAEIDKWANAEEAQQLQKDLATVAKGIKTPDAKP